MKDPRGGACHEAGFAFNVPSVDDVANRVLGNRIYATAIQANLESTPCIRPTRTGAPTFARTGPHR